MNMKTNYLRLSLLIMGILFVKEISEYFAANPSVHSSQTIFGLVMAIVFFVSLVLVFTVPLLGRTRVVAATSSALISLALFLRLVSFDTVRLSFIILVALVLIAAILFTEQIIAYTFPPQGSSDQDTQSVEIYSDAEQIDAEPELVRTITFFEDDDLPPAN